MLHPESFQLEKSGSRIFVNVPEKKEIEVIDTAKHSVLTRWPVSAEDNFPMALDEANHRLLLGVWKPPQLLVFDTQTGKQVAAGEISGKTDDLFYDSLRRRVYVLTSVGYLEVFEQKDADHYNRISVTRLHRALEPVSLFKSGECCLWLSRPRMTGVLRFGCTRRIKSRIVIQ